MSLPNPSMSFTPLDPLPAADLNDIVENVEALAAGTGLNNAAVAPGKLATGAASATVATSQSRSNTTYGDLATTGPAVTVTIGANGLALVVITSNGTSDTSADYVKVSFAASGANTIAAADARALIFRNSSGSQDSAASWSYLATGLSTGSTTFTLKYANSGGAGTATFKNRYISVIPL